MPDPRPPGDLPPDLPPEYAEAYRRGYQRAYLEASGRSGEQEPDREVPTEPAPVVRGPLFADEYAGFLDDDDDAEPTQAIHLTEVPETGPGSHEAVESFDSGPLGFLRRRPAADEPGSTDLHADADLGHRWEQDVDRSAEERARHRPDWFVPAVLAGLVVLLVIGAFGIGRILSSSMGDAEVSAPGPDGVVLGGETATSQEPGEATPRRERRDGYQGRVEAVTVAAASATCQAPGSVDAAGNRVDYPPANASDGDLTTAWRCNGAGVGQSLTLTLAAPARIGEVGLVPGYAKTDPRSGVDRYAENNRITRVRWTFDDGSTVVQRLDEAATNRSVQTMRIKPARSGTVVLEVLSSVRGARNTMAVSEISVAKVAQ